MTSACVCVCVCVRLSVGLTDVSEYVFVLPHCSVCLAILAPAAIAVEWTDFIVTEVDPMPGYISGCVRRHIRAAHTRHSGDFRPRNYRNVLLTARVGYAVHPSIANDRMPLLSDDVA